MRLITSFFFVAVSAYWCPLCNHIFRTGWGWNIEVGGPFTLIRNRAFIIVTSKNFPAIFQIFPSACGVQNISCDLRSPQTIPGACGAQKVSCGLRPPQIFLAPPAPENFPAGSPPKNGPIFFPWNSSIASTECLFFWCVPKSALEA